RVASAELIKPLLAKGDQVVLTARGHALTRTRGRLEPQLARAVGAAAARERRRELAVPRQIDDLTSDIPWTRIGVSPSVFPELVHERQKHRLQRKIRPVLIERRRPDQHFPGSGRTLCERRRTVVEPRRNRRAGERRKCAIAKEARRREISAARRVE